MRTVPAGLRFFTPESSESMALPINIPDLFTGTVVEWERLEFKEGWNPEVVLHTLCAFANDLHNWGGGYLVIGIAERDGLPVLPATGLRPDQIDRIQKEILSVAHRITPAYHPVVEPYVLDGRHVLVLWAPGGQNRPYKAPVSLGKG
jgi:ATP-dependent DNA helicase RecG